MKNWKKFFKGKKITMLGLGVLGRGVNVAKFLARYGARLTVTDLKTAVELKSSLKELRRYKNIKFVFGRHRLRDFEKADLVVKAAGVPLNSPYIARACLRGIPVVMDASLFAVFSPTTIVGVTGTRGKSTTTHLLVHILKKTGRRVLIGGNVRGMATLPILEKTRAGDIVVLELDSWQLQGFGEAKISPSLAVFTTFYPDHLNYYGGSMRRYFADKAQIFKNQTPEDVLIVGRQAQPFIKKWGGKINGRIIMPPASLPRNFKIFIPGEHNKYNAALAAAAARRLGVADKTIYAAIADFRGVPGRLELVRTVRDIPIYNDTTSTTPEAAIAALEALGAGGKRNIILIAGGADKNLKLAMLARTINKRCRVLLLLSGTGTEKLKKEKLTVPTIDEFRDFGTAIKRASALARRGDVILFSPGFASFGMFRNEFDRGDKFNALVKKI